MRWTSSLTGFLLLAGFCLAADTQPAPDGRCILSSPVTHSDWMVRKPAPKWGPEGVRQILDRCREAGLRRVYWRCFDGGRGLYPSRLLEPLHGFDEDNYHRGRDSEWLLDVLKPLDWGSFDALKEAIDYGHKIGIEVHAWLSINEDDHAWGLISRFSREHPELRWVRRDGRPFRSQLSFAFPAVREYKLALLREILAYKPDGVFFDWIRTGDVRDGPQTDAEGVAIHGYEQPNVEALKKAFGVEATAVPNNDERWIKIRVEPQTIFMHDAAAMIRKANPKMPITALVHHPWGHRGGPTETPYKDCRSGLLLDVRRWAADRLVDEFIPAGYYRNDGNAEKACRWLQEETQGKARVGVFGWIASPDQFAGDIQLVQKLGSPELLLWESDYLGLPPAKADLVGVMAGCAQPQTKKDK